MSDLDEDDRMVAGAALGTVGALSGLWLVLHMEVEPLHEPLSEPITGPIDVAPG